MHNIFVCKLYWFYGYYLKIQKYKIDMIVHYLHMCFRNNFFLYLIIIIFVFYFYTYKCILIYLYNLKCTLNYFVSFF